MRAGPARLLKAPFPSGVLVCAMQFIVLREFQETTHDPPEATAVQSLRPASIGSLTFVCAHRISHLGSGVDVLPWANRPTVIAIERTGNVHLMR